MLFSRSVEYSIRALGRLAEAPEGRHEMARRIADEEGLPAFFLAKTLQTLARQGIVRSSKGPTGGFKLARPARKIRLLDIVEALDGGENLQTGLADLPNFKPVRGVILTYLRTTTIADVVEQRARERAARRRKAAKKARPKAPTKPPTLKPRKARPAADS